MRFDKVIAKIEGCNFLPYNAVYYCYGYSLFCLPIDVQQSVLCTVSHRIFLRLQFPHK